MRKLALISAALLAGAAPAHAATIIFTGGSSATSGTAGNIRTFSGGGISVQASAFSYNSATLGTGWLGDYSSGLGVTDGSEGNGGSNNSHTIDNVGQYNLVLLVFDRAVKISSAVLTPFQIAAPAAADNDAWVSYGTLAGAFTSTPTPVAPGSGVWATLNTNGTNNAGNLGAGNLTTFSTAGHFANVWVIGAARPGFGAFDANADGFKLGAITVAAIPEPATWALTIAGFAVVGAAPAAQAGAARRPRLSALKRRGSAAARESVRG
ncbi:MAG: hypothetical protein H0X36_07530 [Sphingomonadaceae bacterium]|nr:hypothetical protein [Sphingomonadaceae bacterium]